MARICQPGAAETPMTPGKAWVGRGKNGFYLGYQSLFLTDLEGFPLSHEEAPANLNEKELTEPLLDRILGENLEIEVVAADSQQESPRIFQCLEERKMGHIIVWRQLKGRDNPPDVLTVKDRISVEGPEYLRCIYGRLKAMPESLNGRVKARLAYSRFTWQGLDNASIHVSIIFCIMYAAVIAAYRIGSPALRYSIAYFA